MLLVEERKRKKFKLVRFLPLWRKSARETPAQLDNKTELTQGSPSGVQ
jgi:hypothetical protein